MDSIDIIIGDRTSPIDIDIGRPTRPTNIDIIDIPPGSETEFVMRKDVDSELDENSINPVQNKTITVVINQIIEQLGYTPKIYFDTKDNWASQPTRISEKDAIYVYTDNHTDSQGNELASIKIGDGLAYVVDLPFIDQGIYEHIEDDTIHITNEERIFWNNKVRCYYSEVTDDENLIFTTQ